MGELPENKFQEKAPTRSPHQFQSPAVSTLTSRLNLGAVRSDNEDDSKLLPQKLRLMFDSDEVRSQRVDNGSKVKRLDPKGSWRKGQVNVSSLQGRHSASAPQLGCRERDEALATGLTGSPEQTPRYRAFLSFLYSARKKTVDNR